MRRCSAPISMPANAAMPAAADRPSTTSPTTSSRASPSSRPRSRSAIRSIRRPGRRDHHARASGEDRRLCRRRPPATARRVATAATPLDLGMPASIMAPTILSGVTPDMAVAREEVFGPVLSVLTFETTEEAFAHCQCHRLWSVGRRLEPRLRHLPDGRPPGARRNGLDEHLHGRRIRTAVRRLQAVRPRPRTRPACGGGLYRDEDDQHASSAARAPAGGCG